MIRFVLPFQTHTSDDELTSILNKVRDLTERLDTYVSFNRPASQGSSTPIDEESGEFNRTTTASFARENGDGMAEVIFQQINNPIDEYEQITSLAVASSSLTRDGYDGVTDLPVQRSHNPIHAEILKTNIVAEPSETVPSSLLKLRKAPKSAVVKPFVEPHKSEWQIPVQLQKIAGNPPIHCLVRRTSQSVHSIPKHLLIGLTNNALPLHLDSPPYAHP